MTGTPSSYDRELAEFERLMERLGRQRFTIHEFNAEHDGPEVLAAVHSWGDVADVGIVIDEHQACAYRTPLGDAKGRAIDVFAPEAVFCWYTGSPAWTIRTLLELPQPAHPSAPCGLIAAPPMFRYQKSVRRAERIRWRR